ncbi:hypothetical protein CRN42_09060 [Vibrio vulnificus]|nr:hypothetical protein CRN42_09060 [Vibrio vulnificus]
MRKVGLCGTHPLTRRYTNYSEQQTYYMEKLTSI